MSRPITRKDVLIVVIVLALLAGFTGIAQGAGLLPGLQPPAAPDVPTGAVMYFHASVCPAVGVSSLRRAGATSSPWSPVVRCAARRAQRSP